ncbi:MAG: VWA domain-containing protein [Pseudomonadota bacterium]
MMMMGDETNAASGDIRTRHETGVDPRWARAIEATALSVLEPAAIGGIIVNARHGPVRSAWRQNMNAQADANGFEIAVIPSHVATDRLTGGLDLAATLAAGRPIYDAGLLALRTGPVLFLVEGLERQTPSNLALIIQALDRSRAQTHPALIVAFDETDPDDEATVARRQRPDALADRCGIWLDLDGLSVADCGLCASDIDQAPTIEKKRPAPQTIATTPDVLVEAANGAADALGVAGLRAVLATLGAARAAAKAVGAEAVAPEHLATAVQLVLAPRATRFPASEDNDEDLHEPDPEPDQSDPDARGDDEEVNALDDQLIDAARAVLPKELLEQLAAGLSESGRAMASGASGRLIKSGQRGRPFGARRGHPDAIKRLNLLETLRAAAPWQTLRASASLTDAKGRPRVHVRRDDFRVYRRRDRAETLAIFVVDASGSSAVKRLAEAKGAIEIMLADSYARRDHVALVSVRGKHAELLVPPTRSQTRARRCLSGLPGGGGTPIASGLALAGDIASAARRKGQQPLVIVLTDGQANIARDGTPGRKQAQVDAADAARMLQADGLAALLIDTSPRPQPRAQTLAAALGGRYIALPRSDAAGVATVASSAIASVRTGTSSTGTSAIGASQGRRQ